METFAPTANGLRIQRFYGLRPRSVVESDERENGYVKSVAIREQPIMGWAFTLNIPTREAWEYLHDFFNRQNGTAGRFLVQLPELVPSPGVGPTLTAISGGSQGSRTMFVKFAWKDTAG